MRVGYILGCPPIMPTVDDTENLISTNLKSCISGNDPTSTSTFIDSSVNI